MVSGRFRMACFPFGSVQSSPYSPSWSTNPRRVRISTGASLPAPIGSCGGGYGNGRNHFCYILVDIRFAKIEPLNLHERLHSAPCQPFPPLRGWPPPNSAIHGTFHFQVSSPLEFLRPWSVPGSLALHPDMLQYHRGNGRTVVRSLPSACLNSLCMPGSHTLRIHLGSAAPQPLDTGLLQVHRI